MSRITKELAKSIAGKLTEKSKLAMYDAKKEYGKCVRDLYEETIPIEVKEAFKKHPEWFYTRSSISFEGHGFSYENVIVNPYVICNGSANLSLNSKSADKLMKFKRKVEKSKKQYDELFSETENALLALRTYKNIEENIPAAKPFLPPPISNSLVCNFESLNKKISNQPEVTAKEIA